MELKKNLEKDTKTNLEKKIHYMNFQGQQKGNWKNKVLI